MSEFPQFPPGFIFGAATASYQIEGAPKEDGKGPSIWDEFAHTPGKIVTGETGDVACDHYRRVREDVQLMKELGLNSYRFSISWPRILPQGTGAVNEKGCDFYRMLVEELRSAGIRPFATLYHWDLPLALQERGGWANRDSVKWFEEYTARTEEALGAQVHDWITLNEPYVHAVLGNVLGTHAPGNKNIWKHYKTLHNLLRGHGAAARLLKAANPDHQVGITLNLRAIYPETDSAKDKKAVHYADLATRRILLDPIFKGEYPEELLRRIRLFRPKIIEGDMEQIAAPIDFLGVNNYSRDRVRYAWWLPGHNFWMDAMDIPEREYERDGVQYTSMGWEVYEDSLYEVLNLLKNEYRNPPVYITENGAAFTDVVEDGAVHDPKRAAFYKLYTGSVERAIAEGADCRGYFAWTLLDNFEWAEGYSKRFGLIHVDHQTQRRIIKDSGYWFRDLIAAQTAAS